jgi:hypothetical protein
MVSWRSGSGREVLMMHALSAFVHDKDAPAVKAARTASSVGREVLDPNHVIKGLIGPPSDQCNADITAPDEAWLRAWKPKVVVVKHVNALATNAQGRWAWS